MRHGETDYNLRNIVQGGGIDADLNETGRDQGRRFFETYKHLEFEKVFSSELKRTYQTIQSFESVGHKITRLPEFNELNWGILEGAKASPEIRAEFIRMNEAWMRGDLDACVESGESPREAWRRARRGLDRVLETVSTEGNVLICIHGRLMRIILSELLGYGMAKMNLLPHHNTALNLLRVHQGEKIWIEKLNDRAHLGLC